jgi:hypothetical protein
LKFTSRMCRKRFTGTREKHSNANFWKLSAVAP